MNLYKCVLCNLEKRTVWYFEEKKFVVISCDTCQTPMYIWKDHDFPMYADIVKMETHARSNFPNKRLDFRRRKIPYHYHFHVR